MKRMIALVALGPTLLIGLVFGYLLRRVWVCCAWVQPAEHNELYTCQRHRIVYQYKHFIWVRLSRRTRRRMEQATVAAAERMLTRA